MFPGFVMPMMLTIGSTGTIQSLSSITVDAADFAYFNDFATASSQLIIKSDGTIDVTATVLDNYGNSTRTQIGDQTWLVGGTASDYDVYIERTSSGVTGAGAGSLMDVTYNTWFNLGSDRTFIVSSSIGGGGEAYTNAYFLGTLKIAAASDHTTILASCAVYLSSSAQSESGPPP